MAVILYRRRWVNISLQPNWIHESSRTVSVIFTCGIQYTVYTLLLTCIRISMSNSSALAKKLRLSYTNPSICSSGQPTTLFAVDIRIIRTTSYILTVEGNWKVHSFYSSSFSNSRIVCLSVCQVSVLTPDCTSVHSSTYICACLYPYLLFRLSVSLCALFSLSSLSVRPSL